jgi:hypothetical protein
MEIRGIIKKVLPERSGTSNRTGEPWRIASYVLETEERYPQRIMFEVSDGTQGRIARLNLQEGKVYKVFLSFDTSEYDGKVYNRISAYEAREIAE